MVRGDDARQGGGASAPVDLEEERLKVSRRQSVEQPCEVTYVRRGVLAAFNGYHASDKLIAQLATAFAEIMAPRARLYRSREGEFWALIDGPIDHARPLLGTATAALRRTGAEANVSAAFGMAFLHAEASEPTEALMIADHELGVARPARERRKRPRSPGSQRETHA